MQNFASFNSLSNTEQGGQVAQESPFSLTDRSGTITTANTAQQIAPANTKRRGFLIENPGNVLINQTLTANTHSFWVSDVSTAEKSPPSREVAPGESYESPSGGCGTGQLSIIGTVDNQPFIAREW